MSDSMSGPASGRASGSAGGHSGGSMARPDDVDLRSLAGKAPVHFVGVGGDGMCPLAEAMARSGVLVTGCDMAPGVAVEPLTRLGVTVDRGHDPSHVEGAGALVVSAAVPKDHPELQAARSQGIPVLKRARALGEWVRAGAVVAVAGTHGKTTTTAMATHVLVEGGLDPTGFVGGRVAAWGGHLRPGRDDLFVVEADEYDRSFLHLRPSVAVITNVEADHLDIYGDLEGVRAGFREFLEGVAEDGTVLVSADDPGAARFLADVGGKGRSFGFAPGSQLRGVELDTTGERVRFRIVEDGMDRGVVRLRVPGVHNARNALAAAAAGRTMGVEWNRVRAALEKFRGVGRRFELLGEAHGITVVDDYAHHPTELDATLAAAREFRPGARLVAVFQPHLYSRTRDFAPELARALTAADVVWVAEIYPAREAAIPGIDGPFLARKVEAAASKEAGVASKVRSHGELETLAAALAEELRPGDLCLLLGAGSIERVGPELIGELEKNGGTLGGRKGREEENA